MMVIDLDSGRYTKTREGHELYNCRPNVVDDRYYGYCPPLDEVRIENLGAPKTDDEISGVLVVYTKKKPGTNDRMIVAFTDNATVHRYSRKDPALHRIIEEDGKIIHCSYTIESDTMYTLDNYTSKFYIRIADYNPYMFRSQRFYKGKYPDLDKRIIVYLEQYLKNTKDEDSLVFQSEIQDADVDEDKAYDDNSLTRPEYVPLGGGKAVNKKARVSKQALANAHFKCEVDAGHQTFLTDKGVPYMEGHHLIPCAYDNAERFSRERGRNIDCVPNIVCLCPTCHRRVHFGSKKEKAAILKSLYEKRLEKLQSVNLGITLEELMALYE